MMTVQLPEKADLPREPNQHILPMIMTVILMMMQVTQAWKNSTDLDAEPYRMQSTHTHEPGFSYPKAKTGVPLIFFSQNSVDVIVKNTTNLD